MSNPGCKLITGRLRGRPRRGKWGGWRVEGTLAALRTPLPHPRPGPCIVRRPRALNDIPEKGPMRSDTNLFRSPVPHAVYFPIGSRGGVRGCGGGGPLFIWGQFSFPEKFKWFLRRQWTGNLICFSFAPEGRKRGEGGRGGRAGRGADPLLGTPTPTPLDGDHGFGLPLVTPFDPTLPKNLRGPAALHQLPARLWGGCQSPGKTRLHRSAVRMIYGFI